MIKIYWPIEAQKRLRIDAVEPETRHEATPTITHNAVWPADKSWIQSVNLLFKNCLREMDNRRALQNIMIDPSPKGWAAL